MTNDSGAARQDLPPEGGHRANEAPASSANASADPPRQAPETAEIAPCPATAEGETRETPQRFEDLTLSDLIQRWLRAPGPTWARLRLAMTRAATSASPPRAALQPAVVSPSASGRGLAALSTLRNWPRALRRVEAIQLILYAAAILCALIGSVIARGADHVTRANDYSLNVGGVYLWLAFWLWIIAEVVGNWTGLKAYWLALDRGGRWRWAARALPILIWINALFTLVGSMTAPRESATGMALAALVLSAIGVLLWMLIEIVYWKARNPSAPAAIEAPMIRHRPPARARIWKDVSHLRKLLFVLATLSSLLVWANTSGNHIEPPIILLWLLSAALWGFVFAPLRWNVFDWTSDRLDALRRLRWRDHRAAIIGFLLVMLLGGAFRFYQLDSHPPQMFSDLVEKIQDAYKIYHQDDYRIFLDNIGGREPLHFYLLSILASQPGMAFDHYALKLMSALESFITLPIIFWLGVEVVGERRRKLGLLFGLLAAALVAVSFWHAAIGRQGMRISLAPLFSALTAVYLVRGLRSGRRTDFVKAGLALGFGLMGYQAVRMLPLAAVLAAAIAFIAPGQSRRARLRHILNVGVLAFVSLMVFLPLLHYWMEEPEKFLRRSNTRLFGDLPTTYEERAAFLAESVPVLMSNIRKTALVYHYHGDGTWVSGMSDEPAMDPASAAFLWLGLAAWLLWMIKTRDIVVFFIPIYLLVMLLPTALALSFPIEVPSYIRASGAIPPSYLIAALPAAVFCRCLCRMFSGRLGKVAAAAFAAALVLAANQYNTSLYFGEFTERFIGASFPHAQAGSIVRAFAESDGAYGNAFVLSSPHWWDTRAVGIEAGLMFWDSGGEVQRVPRMIEQGLRRAAPNQLNPERDLLFFYALENPQALEPLSEWFPGGRQMRIDVEPGNKSFYIFRAPALGAENLQRFLDENRPA